MGNRRAAERSGSLGLRALHRRIAQRSGFYGGGTGRRLTMLAALRPAGPMSVSLAEVAGSTVLRYEIEGAALDVLLDDLGDLLGHDDQVQLWLREVADLLAAAVAAGLSAEARSLLAEVALQHLLGLVAGGGDEPATEARRALACLSIAPSAPPAAVCAAA